MHCGGEEDALGADYELPVVRELVVSPARLDVLFGERRQERLVVAVLEFPVLGADKAAVPF